MRVIFLVMIGLSILNADFTKSGDIVTDNTLELQWQDDAVGSPIPWEEAIAYCEALTLGDYSNWRLPNINELKSIVDRSKYYPAIVDGFENSSENKYWSSSYGEYKNYAWGVTFIFGSVGNVSKADSNYVRCVRDRQ